MKTSWTVGKKLFTVFGAIGALVVILGMVSWWATGTLKGALDVATRSTARKLELALVVDGNVRGLRSEQRRSLLAGYANDPETVKAATERIAKLGGDIDSIAYQALATREGGETVQVAH